MAGTGSAETSGPPGGWDYSMLGWRACLECGCYEPFQCMTEECCWKTSGRSCVFQIPATPSASVAPPEPLPEPAAPEPWDPWSSLPWLPDPFPERTAKRRQAVLAIKVQPQYEAFATARPDGEPHTPDVAVPQRLWNKEFAAWTLAWRRHCRASDSAPPEHPSASELQAVIENMGGGE